MKTITTSTATATSKRRRVRSLYVTKYIKNIQQAQEQGLLTDFFAVFEQNKVNRKRLEEHKKETKRINSI